MLSPVFLLKDFTSGNDILHLILVIILQQSSQSLGNVRW